MRSLLHGESPLFQACSNEHTVAETVAAHLAPLFADGTHPATICVVALTHRELEKYRTRLQTVCAEMHPIEPGKPDDGEAPGVRLATIHRVKGLKFDHVILAGFHEIVTRNEPDGSDILLQKHALLCVAAARARKSLLVCWLPRR